jgi:hypothetical protein
MLVRSLVGAWTCTGVGEVARTSDLDAAVQSKPALVLSRTLLLHVLLPAV